MLKNYKELKVWQRSYQLCLEIYKITKIHPRKYFKNSNSQPILDRGRRALASSTSGSQGFRVFGFHTNLLVFLPK